MIEVTLKTQDELRDFIEKSMNKRLAKTRLIISGSLFNDFSKTLVALGKSKGGKSAGLFATIGAAVAAVATGGLAAPVLVAVGGMYAVNYSMEEFRKNPIADEVYSIDKMGFKFERNNGNTVILNN